MLQNDTSSRPSTPRETGLSVATWAALLAGVLTAAPAAAGLPLRPEVEPDNTAATAMALPGTGGVVVGDIYPNADIDWYSFTGGQGDRVYAAVMTSGVQPTTSQNSSLTLIGPDGVTVIETDADDGTYGTTSSSIAGAVLPATGTFYLQVTVSGAVLQMRPYHLHYQVRSGSPIPEEEPANFTPLDRGGWVSGAFTSADVDGFRLSLMAGESVFASLDLDPERDAVALAGRLSLVSVSTGVGITADDLTAGPPPSEAVFFTVNATGEYDVRVSSVAGTGTYHLSVSVLPDAHESPQYLTYSSIDGPIAIPTGPGEISSVIHVPDNWIIEDLDVSLDLNHTDYTDLDAYVVSPEGNMVALFSDPPTPLAPSAMKLRLDDEAALPLGAVTSYLDAAYQPEAGDHLRWFDGERAAGDWKLVVRDDNAGDGGTLNGWSLTISVRQAVRCSPGVARTKIFSADFEPSANGFITSGAGTQWEWGTPNTIPLIVDCAGGARCWKTNLVGSYGVNTVQDLISPAIAVPVSAGPILLEWAQKYQVRDANLDHMYVEVQRAGIPASARRVFEHRDGNMKETFFAPQLEETAGWGVQWADISSFAGQIVEVRFHLDSGPTAVGNAGLAIDDVIISLCAGVAGVETGTSGLADRITAVSPNPASHGTTIGFSLAASATVDLAIHDVSGRMVRSLVKGPVAAGPHEAVWDGRDEQGRRVAPGLYFGSLRSAGSEDQRRIILIH